MPMLLRSFTPRGCCLPLLVLSVLVPALAPAQRVVAWGRNDSGQTDVPPNLGVVNQIAGGQFAATVQRADGSLAAWGFSGYGQLNVPSLNDVVGIASAFDHSLALRANGDVVAWGSNGSGQMNVPMGLTNVTQVAAGIAFSTILQADGYVIGWGSNFYGQCEVPPTLTGVTHIADGGYHVLAVKSDGTVAAWGMTLFGQCEVPVGLKTVTRVAGGSVHSLALKANGTVVAWGDNANGQTAVPAGLNGVVQISAGAGHSMALKSDGKVVAWGINNFGQADVPADLEGVVSISAGGYASYAVVAAARVKLDQTGVFSGYSATGKVRLADPAGPGGMMVDVVSDDAAVHVPASVMVPEGEIEASFPVTTDLFFGPDRNTTIRTSLNGTATIPAKFKVKGNVPTITFGYPTVTGGSTTKPNLTLRFATAPATDVTLNLTISDASTTIPATIKILAGEKSAKVDIGHTLVPSDRVVTVNGLYGGTTVVSSTFKLIQMRALVAFDALIAEGNSTLGAVISLNSPTRNALTISLASDDTAVKVPSTVKIVAGGRIITFPVIVGMVPAAKVVRITAVVNGAPFVGNLRVNAVPAVNAVSLPSTGYGNGKLIGNVHLSIAAKAGGQIVTLSSSNAALTVPATVTVPEGEYGVDFEAFTSDVASATNATVTAKSGLGTATDTVAVQPLSVSAFTLSTAMVSGGGMLTGTVTLNANVLVDTVVQINADNSLAGVPATVTIPAGSKTVIFNITTGTTATVKYVKITATKHASSQYRTLKVNP
ncbi:hypothetical protein EON81_10040 [bacterium]|nr:MAG: hypothetical protein EON81_10040 [bacterium]